MKLKGIAAWASVTKPTKEVKTKSGTVIPSRYSIDLILEDDVAKDLKAKGFNIKTVKEDISGIEGSAGKPYLNIKKPAVYKDGNPTTPPEVVDAACQPFTGLIGNGSTVNVVFAATEWEGFGTTGTAARLHKVQVVDLIEYSNLESFEDETKTTDDTKGVDF